MKFQKQIIKVNQANILLNPLFLKIEYINAKNAGTANTPSVLAIKKRKDLIEVIESIMPPNKLSGDVFG
tara:strand:- start:8763 stop:8969 length:207 start_codon:yes stop_codon:yes gene_type:complete